VAAAAAIVWHFLNGKRVRDENDKCHFVVSHNISMKQVVELESLLLGLFLRCKPEIKAM
jgi:hypothetical protein